MKKKKGFNGHLPWITVLVLIILQSVGVGMWAGHTSERLVNIQKTVIETKQEVKTNTKRINYLEKILQLIVPKKVKFLGWFRQ